jgi:hypothetical protein
MRSIFAAAFAALFLLNLVSHGLARKNVSSASKIISTYPAKITASALRPAAASQPSIGTRADGNAAPVLMGAEPEPI